MKKTVLRPTAFVLVSTNHGSMLVNRHDYRTVPGGAYGVGYQLLENSAFDHEEVDIALQLIESRRKNFGDGVMAIDCGANIGVHTIEWARAMYGWGNVIAFEAQERVFYALAGNLAINNCFNARAIWAAVGAEEGTIRVPVPNYLAPASFGSLEIKPSTSNEFIGQHIDYSDAKTLPTQMRSIDSFALARLDFVKIDIEGMEMDALMGARETIARCRPQLLIEKIKSNEQQIVDFVQERGYTVFPLGINLLAVHESDPVAGEISVG